METSLKISADTAHKQRPTGTAAVSCELKWNAIIIALRSGMLFLTRQKPILQSLLWQPNMALLSYINKVELWKQQLACSFCKATFAATVYFG